MCRCIPGRHDQFNEDNVFCYRTDFSDDEKWNRLLALANSGECPCLDDLCIIEEAANEDKSVQDLLNVSTDTYVLADKQSMADDKFLLAHNDHDWDEDTMQSVGKVLKTRYPANDLWMALILLSMANCSFEDLMPSEPDQQPERKPHTTLRGKAPRMQLNARVLYGGSLNAAPRNDIPQP